MKEQSKQSRKRKVLFLCSGNSARSQMAEALLRHKAGDLFDVFSAGTNPKAIDDQTITALANFGLDNKSLISKNISEFEGQHFDFIITLCDKAEQECRVHPWFSSKAGDRYMAWDFPEPKSRNVANPYSVTLNELNSRLSMFVLVEGKRFESDNIKNEQLPKSDQIASTLGDSLSTRSDHPHNELSLEPIAFYKCLTDEIRLKTLMLVNYHGELCVCELMAALQEQSQPKISRNLALLRKAKILTDRKHGQWVFYRLNPQLPEWARTVLAQTTEHRVDYIAPNLNNLALMNNRPDKTRFCCA